MHAGVVERDTGLSRDRHQEPEIVLREFLEAILRVELNDARRLVVAATDQRRDEGKKRICGGRTDQGHGAALDIGQQNVLLTAAEPMQFVDKDDRLRPVGRQTIGGGLQNFTDFTNSGGRGIEPFEVATSLFRDQFGERRFSGARGSVEDHGTNAVGIQHPPQQFAVAKNMLLP